MQNKNGGKDFNKTKSQKANRPDPRILFPLSEAPDIPLEEEENELDLLQKDYDLLSVKDSPEEADSEPDFDIMTPSTSERFPLKQAFDTNEEEVQLDIMGSPKTTDSFALKSEAIKDKKPVVMAGELMMKVKPLRAAGDRNRIKKTAVITAWIVSVIAVLTIAWFNGGKFYVNHTNEKYYKKLCQGEDLTRVNPDFDFYLTIEGSKKHLPVVKSDKPLYYTAFNGLPFPPGTLTSKKDGDFICVTGSTGLLKLSDKMVGKSIVCTDGKSTVTYAIYSAHECTKDFSHVRDDAGLTVFVEDASAKNGIFAIHAVKE